MRIKLDIMDNVARQSVSAAVHHAMERFRADFGEQEGLAARVAQAAAESAVEQFRAWANAELRLIEIDMERRADEAMMRRRSIFY